MGALNAEERGVSDSGEEDPTGTGAIGALGAGEEELADAGELGALGAGGAGAADPRVPIASGASGAGAADPREPTLSGAGEAHKRDESRGCAHSYGEGESLQAHEVREHIKLCGEEPCQKPDKRQDLPQIHPAKTPTKTHIEARSYWQEKRIEVHWDGSDALPEALLDSCMNAIRSLHNPLRTGDTSTVKDALAQGKSSHPFDSATQERTTANSPWKRPITGEAEARQTGNSLVQDNSLQTGQNLLQGNDVQTGHNRRASHSLGEEQDPDRTQEGGDEKSRPATPIILIDGLSGAGKSTLAQALARSLASSLSCDFASHGPVEPVRVLALDSLYEGWHGLEAGSTIASRIVKDLAEARPARYRPWDWENESRGEELIIEAGAPLIIEGCGALTRESRRYAAIALWVEAAGGEKERYRRAIGRDGEMFRAWWETWAEQDLGRLAGPRPGGDTTQLVGRADTDPSAYADLRADLQQRRTRMEADPRPHADLRAAGISSAKATTDPRAYADLLVIT